MYREKSSESGQVLVLLALGFVVLLGFVALALDGGMAYSDRRNSQNGADAASLAGGGAAALSLENAGVLYGNWNCADARMGAAQTAAINAAIGRADDNQFVIDNNVSDHNGVTFSCEQEMRNGFMDKYLDITTQISVTTDTNFMELFSGGQLINKVEAITRVRPRSPLVFGNAVVALNPANCQGQQNGAGFHGNPDVFVTGGGIFSNGCLQADGNTDITVVDGGVTGNDIQNGSKFNPDAQSSNGTQMPPTAYEIPAPNCNHPAAHNVTSLSGTLAPGLYCVTGNLRINANDTLIGQDVTIVLLNGELRINGNATVQLDAPERNPDPSPAIPGIVIYAPPSNHNEIQITGNSASFFEGTILAPGANINMLGNGATDAFRAQVIGWNVEIGGTADTNVVFNEEKAYSKPASLELFK
jgi:Flp pilus assembly protein TadG